MSCSVRRRKGRAPGRGGQRAKRVGGVGAVRKIGSRVGEDQLVNLIIYPPQSNYELQREETEWKGPRAVGGNERSEWGGWGWYEKIGSRVGEDQLANLIIYPPQSLALWGG